MANAMTILMILLVTMAVVTCQIFQYTPPGGWTPGKRANHDGALGGGVDGGLPSEFNMNFPAQGAIIRRTNDPDTIHCGLRKLRILLRGNTNDQLYHLPCQLLNILSNRDVQSNQQVQPKNSRHTSDFFDNDNYNNNN